MGLTSWPSLGPSEGPSYVLAMDVSHKPFPEKIQKRPAGNTFTHAPRFLSFWACSHMEMPSGGEVRCPKGQVKHRDDSKLPKATKTEESADSKEVKAVPFCFQCFVLRAERFLSCIAWIIKFNTTRGPLEMLKADETEWKGEVEHCTKLPPRVNAFIDKEFPTNSQTSKSKPEDNWKGCGGCTRVATITMRKREV